MNHTVKSFIKSDHPVMNEVTFSSAGSRHKFTKAIYDLNTPHYIEALQEINQTEYAREPFEYMVEIEYSAGDGMPDRVNIFGTNGFSQMFEVHPVTMQGENDAAEIFATLLRLRAPQSTFTFIIV